MEFAQPLRAVRKPFVAAITITDIASERQLSTHTSDLSLNGCFVSTPTPFYKGDNIRMVIVHAADKMEVFGRVVYANAEGMGVAFTRIEPQNQEVLYRWMNDLLSANS